MKDKLHGLTLTGGQGWSGSGRCTTVHIWVGEEEVPFKIPTVVVSTHQVSSAVIVIVTISFSKTTRIAGGAAMPVILGRNAVFIYTAVQFRMGSIPAVVVSTHQVSSAFTVLVTVSSALVTRIHLSAATPEAFCTFYYIHFFTIFSWEWVKNG